MTDCPDTAPEVLRVRVKPSNIAMVGDLLRLSLLGVPFTYIRDNPIDLGDTVMHQGLRLAQARGPEAIEILGPLQAGERLAAGLRLHYDPTSSAGGKEAGAPLVHVLGTTDFEPIPSSPDPELRIDRRPLLTVVDNLLVFRCDNLLQDASTEIFLVSSGIDWRMISERSG